MDENDLEFMIHLPPFPKLRDYISQVQESPLLLNVGLRVDTGLCVDWVGTLPTELHRSLDESLHMSVEANSYSESMHSRQPAKSRGPVGSSFTLC